MFETVIFYMASIMVITVLVILIFTSGNYAKKLDMKLHKKHGK